MEQDVVTINGWIYVFGTVEAPLQIMRNVAWNDMQQLAATLINREFPTATSKKLYLKNDFHKNTSITIKKRTKLKKGRKKEVGLGWMEKYMQRKWSWKQKEALKEDQQNDAKWKCNKNVREEGKGII